MAQWQKTNTNFSSTNGAMANAASAFDKAGGLALNISQQIEQEKVNEATKTAQLNASMQGAEKTAYLLDTENRDVRVEQAQHDLNIERQKALNNGLVTISDTAEAEAKADFLQTVNDDVKANYVPEGAEGYDQVPGQVYTRPKVGPDGQPLMQQMPDGTTQPIMESYKVNGYTQNKFEALPEEVQQFQRTAFINKMTEKLLATGQYTPTTAQAAAVNEANNLLGALASKDTIDGQTAALDKVVDNKTKVIESILKAQQKNGTTVNINGGTGTSGSGGNGYSTSNYTNTNDPEKNLEWINKNFSTSRGPIDGLATVFSSDTALNQNIVRKNQAEYVTDYGVTPAQYRAFMNGVMKDGVIGDEQAPDTMFTGTDAQKKAIAQKMKTYGNDKESVSTKVKGTNGSNNAAAIKAQYKQYEELVTKSDEVNQAYLKDVQASYAAATPKSKQQLLANFKNHQMKLIKSQLKTVPITKTTTQTLTKDGKTSTALFTGKDPISQAMKTKDAAGESSLLKLQMNSPKEFKGYIEALSKPERAKVLSYMNKPATQAIMKKYTEAALKNGKTGEKVVVKEEGKTVGSNTNPRSHRPGFTSKSEEVKEDPVVEVKTNRTMSLPEQRRYIQMSDTEVSNIPMRERIQILQQYNLPTDLTKKLARGLY